MFKKKVLKIYKNYIDENLDKVVVVVKSGIMLYRKVCDIFKVFKIIVLNRVNGDVVDSGDGIKVGCRFVFFMEVE